MLEGYFDNSADTDEEALTLTQRLLAVQAALEIAKASVGSTDAATACKTDLDLKYVTEQISGLADAIQEALKVG